MTSYHERLADLYGLDPNLFCLCIGGCRIDLRINRRLLERSFAPFLCPQESAPPPPHWFLAVSEDARIVPTGPDPDFPPRLKRRSGRIALEGPCYLMELSPAAGAGRATIAPGTRYHRVLLQLALAEWLAPRGGLLLHGCGLAAGGRGWLFVGPSGAGKSTVAELAGGPVLSDETCVVRLAPDGGVTLAGTPIGISAAAGPVPLAGILWLEQSPLDELEPLPPAQALARLMTQAVAAGRRGKDLGPLMETAAAVLDRIPMRTLRFTRSRRFVDVVRLGS